MPAQPIRDFHVHLYFDPDEVERARSVAAELQRRFSVPIGHFHMGPVGPHPRGSVQVTVPPAQFGDVAAFLAVGREGLTVFAHASTEDDLADHSDHVIWLGPSEPLDLSIFR